MPIIHRLATTNKAKCGAYASVENKNGTWGSPILTCDECKRLER